MKRGGFSKRWLRTSVLAITAVLLSVSPGLAQSRVAVLTPGLAFDPVLKGLREGLAGLGYEEGKNIIFIVEDTKGAAPDLVARGAAKLVATKPDLFFTVASSHTAAAKEATSTLPIVFAWAAEPVRFGWAESFASSKTNMTGVATASVPLSGKRLEILKEIAPGIKRVLAIVSAKEIIAETVFQVLDETAKKFGIQILRRDVTSKEEIEKVISATPKGSVDAIYHVPSGLVGAHIDLLIKKAKEDRIPLVTHEDTMVVKGALLSYGADFQLVGLQAARLVAKVLKGMRPTDIPIETPERQILAINLTTARTIGLKLPVSVLEKADRVLE